MPPSKVRIERIEGYKLRRSTFLKRKLGLIKKAIELTVLCDCDCAILLRSSSPGKTLSSRDGHFVSYCNRDLQTMLRECADEIATTQQITNAEYEHLSKDQDAIDQVAQAVNSTMDKPRRTIHDVKQRSDVSQDEGNKHSSQKRNLADFDTAAHRRGGIVARALPADTNMDGWGGHAGAINAHTEKEMFLLQKLSQLEKELADVQRASRGGLIFQPAQSAPHGMHMAAGMPPGVAMSSYFPDGVMQSMVPAGMAAIAGYHHPSAYSSSGYTSQSANRGHGDEQAGEGGGFASFGDGRAGKDNPSQYEQLLQGPPQQMTPMHHMNSTFVYGYRPMMDHQLNAPGGVAQPGALPDRGFQNYGGMPPLQSWMSQPASNQGVLWNEDAAATTTSLFGATERTTASSDQVVLRTSELRDGASATGEARNAASFQNADSEYGSSSKPKPFALADKAKQPWEGNK